MRDKVENRGMTKRKAAKNHADRRDGSTAKE
jgi:hypothetical protein